METSSQAGRRQGRRSVLRGPATLVCGGVQILARSWDVGLDGMSLLTKRPISPGTRCSASFDLPSNGTTTRVSAELKVVYSSYSGPDGFKLGMVFLALSPQAAEALSHFMAAA